MNRLFFGAALACLFLFVAGCREDALIGPGDIQALQAYMTIGSYSENGKIYISPSSDSIYLQQGFRYTFEAKYLVGGHEIRPDSAQEVYRSHFWDLGDDSVNATILEHLFDSAGYYLFVLNTIDYGGDTLKDTAHIFVSTPLSIHLSAPAEGSSIEPLSDDYVEMNWDISGIDPWEKTSCSIYAAVADDIQLNRASSYFSRPTSSWLGVLDTLDPLYTGDCQNGALLKGPLISEEWLKRNGFNLRDTSLTVYWGVKATAYTENGFEEYSSDVSMFNTLFLGGDSSVIQIKPTYESLVTGTSVSTRIVLVSALGDTLKDFLYDTPKQATSVKVAPQTRLRLYAHETKLTDYEPKTITIDVPEHSIVRLADSIVFTDKIPPKAAPVKNDFALSDSIKFYFMDMGSGINPTQKKFILADYDTVDVAYESSTLTFANPCRRECKIKIPIPDNARNRNTELFWTMTPFKDSLHIAGPFVQTEEQQ